MGRPTPLKVNGANFSTLLPLRGCNFYPILRYGLTEPASLFKCGPISHFCEIHSLSYDGINFFRNVKSMGQLWDAPAHPGVQLLPPFEVFGLTEPASLFKCGKFQTSVKSTL